MKLIAYYAVYNEADFIEASLASIYPFVDRIIIIEGAWKETYSVNGKLRSDDGTIEKIKAFDDPQDKIELYFHNEEDQLKQRNALWTYLREDCMMLLVDGDEVYPHSEISVVRSVANGNDPVEAMYTIDSKVFVNDLYTYTPIRFPRLWRLYGGSQYRFVEPNTLTKDSQPFGTKVDLDACYFHYSYCHSPARFMEKKKERTKKHGQFSWEMREGLVQKDGVQFTEYMGKHPETMQGHSKLGQRAHRTVEKPEVIVYVEHSGIGNLVLATPLLQALRQAKPDAHIYVISWKRAYRILEGLHFFDSIIAVDEPNQMAQLLNTKIDHLFISPVGALGQVVDWLKQRSTTVHNLSVGSPWTKHEAEYKLAMAKKIGWRGRAPSCDVGLFEYQVDNARRILMAKGWKDTDLIGINAAYLKNEHWPLKHWGNDKYRELINRMHLEMGNYTYVFVGSSEDHADVEEIIGGLEVPANVINMCGFSNDIKDTAAVLDLCRIVLGNDGGLQHIAAALDIPTLTIFTFTNPVKNKPFGNRGKVIMVPCENRLTCQHGNWQRCKDNGCLDLPVETVLMAVKNELGG